MRLRDTKGQALTAEPIARGDTTDANVPAAQNFLPDQCDGATQVIAYVVSGVGFLGAGVILKQGNSVSGLNTAATLWCSAAVGACAGADLAFEAIALTCFVLAGNTLLRPLVNAINRAPIDQRATEAIYEVRLTTSPEHLDESRELLRDQLESANYPPQGIDVVEREQGGQS